MSNVSSKFIHMLSAEALLTSEKKSNDSTHDGILLLTNFGFVYGQFSKVEPSDNTNVVNVLLGLRENFSNKFESEGDTIIGNGSVVVLENAVVKYTNNMTISMKEIIIFCDDIVGYYPVDLSKFSEQLPQI